MQNIYRNSDVSLLVSLVDSLRREGFEVGPVVEPETFGEVPYFTTNASSARISVERKRLIWIDD